jgi:hypothetical protein
MGAKNSKNTYIDRNSSSSVFEESLKSSMDKNNPSPKIQLRDELINELKQVVTLPIENDCVDSPEIIFEKKEEPEIKNIFEEGEDDDYRDFLNKFFPEDEFDIKQSKTFEPKLVMPKTPRLLPKDLDMRFIKPFRLEGKSFGIVSKENKKTNHILSSFDMDFIDSKSCNDKAEEGIEEFLLQNYYTEKTTPNQEDLLELINCRKKMFKFRNSIDYKYCHEYENILNYDNIIENIYEDEENNHKPKKSFYKKYIQQQMKEEQRKASNKTDDKEKSDDDDLFFLGVLEKAHKDRKRAKSFRSVQIK